MNSGKIPTASSKRAWLQTSFPQVSPYFVSWEIPRWDFSTTFERFPQMVSPTKMVSKSKKNSAKSWKKTNNKKGTFKGLLPKMISWNHPSLANLSLYITVKNTRRLNVPSRSPWRSLLWSLFCSDTQDTCQIVATYDLPGITGAHGHGKVSELRIPRQNASGGFLLGFWKRYQDTNQNPTQNFHEMFWSSF